MLKDIALRPIKGTDSEISRILKWRNDLVTRSMSFHGELKSYADFKKEFYKRYFELNKLPPFFIVYHQEPIGVIFFSSFSQQDACLVSINLDSDKRNKGLGSDTLKKIQSYVKKKGYRYIYAFIKTENIRAIKAFEKAGFYLREKKQKIQDNNDCVDICLYSIDLKKKDSVFIIAEAGVNWRLGSIENDRAMAKLLIELAKEAGADAIKFQLYHPEGVYVPNAGKASYLTKNGVDKDINTLFAEYALPADRIAELAEYAYTLDIEFMCSSFSKKDFLAINPFVTRHKIASYEITHLRLIELAAQSNKPLILSTGASSEADIAWAVSTFKKHGGKDLTLMQCTAQYPADPESMQLQTISRLKNRFGSTVGLSDHSEHPLHAPLAAVAIGAKVIEKHFTIDKRLPGPDHFFAITDSQLKEMVGAIRQVEKMLGEERKCVFEKEKELYSFAKRGIQAIKPISKGDILKEGINIDILRAGVQPRGLHPKYLTEIEGKKAEKSILLGHGIQIGDWNENQLKSTVR